MPDEQDIENSAEAEERSHLAAYSAFSPRQKNCIIGLAAFAGWFSSISSFIYFPAIPYLASDLNVGIDKINLTVTSYLIMSGVFPSIVGDIADRFGRRPVFIVALTTYLCANVGLALQSSFGLLFFFRMLQSAGISGTFSITYGVLGDLFTPAERGGYSGMISLFLNTPPSIGPLISGLLLLRWSWRAVFWFLSAATPCCLIPMVLFLPETARNIVGDGTSVVSAFNKPLFSILLARPQTSSLVVQSIQRDATQHRIPNPLASVKLLRFPGTAIMLIAYGLGYSVYTCLQASLSTLFLDIYYVSGVMSGLIYIPFGVACAISAFTTGKLLDHNYRKVATAMGIVVDKTRADNLRQFPIERARLRYIQPLLLLSAAFIVGYGWLLERQISIAGPLVIQFCIGLTLQCLFTALNTLIVDTHQACPSTAQAACNFVRCELSAGFLAFLDPLLRTLGPGWCFAFFASLIFVFAIPGLLVLQRFGLQWRQRESGAFLARELGTDGTSMGLQEIEVVQTNK